MTKKELLIKLHELLRTANSISYSPVQSAIYSNACLLALIYLIENLEDLQ